MYEGDAAPEDKCPGACGGTELVGLHGADSDNSKLRLSALVQKGNRQELSLPFIILQGQFVEPQVPYLACPFARWCRALRALIEWRGPSTGLEGLREKRPN